MPHAARTHRATRQLVVAAVVALAAWSVGSAVEPAHAQSIHASAQPSVTVDFSVLDHLGPAPRVPDGRFVLRVPERPGTRVALHHVRGHRSHAVARRVVHHPVRRLAQVHAVRHLAAVVRDGSVTIDYAALPPRVDTSGPRIVLRRPGTATVAAAAPAVDQPEAPLTPSAHSAVQQAVVLTPPAPRPPLSPTPTAPLPPRVATAPPRPDTSELASLLPIGGVALAATRSPTEPVADSNAPRSDNRAIRFAPGTAALQGDAPAVLDGLAQKLKAAPNERIELVAYASGDADQAIEARRVSLARAVMVRAYLIQHGVASTRIDVRALGNRVTDGGSADRVDLVTTGR
jgi:outer membrane protein OmpA-like peptidoglycan-associated protein